MKESKSLTEFIEKVKTWMSEYDPSVLYKWIIITSIHPSNQKFLTRFEFLLAILTSIKIEEFRNKVLNYQAFSLFISKFKEESDSFFLRVEDFIHFSQLKLIPYFFEGKKYYFFYGQLERTYESIRILEKIYICNTDEHSELKLIKDLFLQVLEYQTRLLNKLIQIEESKAVFEDAIYLPTENFFGEIKKLIEINGEKIVDSRYVLHFKERKDMVENFKKIIYGGYFEDLYLKLSKSEIALILPHIMTEVLYKIFEKIVRDSDHKDTIQKAIQNNVIYNVMDIFLKFFNKRDLMDSILNDRREIISNETNLIVLFENNLFLFDVVDLFSTLDLSARINKSHERLKRIEQKIMKERIIHIKFANRYYHEVATNEIKIIKIILYEPIDLTPGPILFDFQTDSRMTILSIKDLISIFELISSPLKFIKFLEEKYSSSRFFTFDQIDIFAAFYNNNESLPAPGTGFISFATHLWSDFYNKYLMEKYKDSIYELIELDIPNKFTDVKKWMDSQDLYEGFDKRDLFSANIIKLNDRLIWIFNPHINPILESEDHEFAMKVIGPLYADYIQRIIKPFEELVSKYTSIKEYSIFLTPHKICKSKPFLNQFERDYGKINEENPIIVNSFINTYSKLISNVFYNHELWGDKFSGSSNNENARYAIRQLIFSIIEHFEPHLSEEEAYSKTDDFLTINFINSERDYYLEAIPARNINIKKYPAYLKINSTDQEKVIKEVEAYFREKKLSQGHLTPEESKNLFNEIYSTFYERLKDILSYFDVSILYYAYKQLESVEGKRYLIKLEAGMKNPSQIDESYKNYFEKNYDEINKLSSTHRFIISNTLKFGVKGTKKISSVEYSYIQALSLYLVSISQISDFTHSKLIEYTVNIKDFYKFDELRNSSIFDYDAYKEVESKNKLEATKKFYNNIISEPEMAKKTFSVPEKEKILIKKIEEAFQSRLSFSFTNMMRILSLLSSSNQINNDIMLFPSVLIDKENLVKLLQDEYKREYGTRPTFTGDLINLVSETEVRAILDFLSLDFKSFEEVDMLLHLRIMKQKNRLTLCPLIDINNQILFGKQCCNVAFQIWRRNIFAGVFPYKIPVNDKLSVALQKLHSYQDKIFEDECGEIAEQVLGNGNSIVRLKNFERISASFPKNPNCGEIDLLAVNPDTKTFFVLDSKNYFLKLSPGDIKNEINRFITKKKSDLIKLEKKESFVRNNIDFFLDYFKISDRQSWNFKKGFIIKYNFPSAYVKDVDADFIFQSDLAQYLKK